MNFLIFFFVLSFFNLLVIILFNCFEKNFIGNCMKPRNITPRIFAQSSILRSHTNHRFMSLNKDHIKQHDHDLFCFEANLRNSYY